MDLDKLSQIAKNNSLNVNIKYKNESLFMKILSFLLFFNKKFMTEYTTTINSTIYFPSKDFVNKNYITSATIFLHELVHVLDARSYNFIIFSFLYLSPQILAILFLPLLFLNVWISLVFLLFLLPIPSFFRMKFEKRAYLVSLYALHQLIINKKVRDNLESSKDFYLHQFKSSNYYFMWPFKSLDATFEKSLNDIKANKRPYEDSIFDIIDKIIKEI